MNPKNPKEYLFSEQCLANVPQDSRMGTPLAEALLDTWRNKHVNPQFLKRWLSVLTPLVWGKGRPLVAEEDAALILSVFQELRKEEFPPELALAVPTIVALADNAAAEHFLATNTGKAFRELIPVKSGITQQPSLPAPSAPTTQQKAPGPFTEEGQQSPKIPETKKSLTSPAFESLGLREKELLESLVGLLASNKSEAQSLALRLEQVQKKLQDAEKELNNLFQGRANLQKTLTEERAAWDTERSDLLGQNERARADIHTLEETKRSLSNEITSLHAEVEQTARQHKVELDNQRHQWVNTLLEKVRPHAADVRDHILRLRKERPQDEAIRFLAISYYNTHRALARMMDLNPADECLPQDCLNQTNPE